jgi:hypothetical protein
MSRPVLALALKGDKFTDPIDGKVLKRSCLMAMERKETMSYHHTLSLERHRLLWLFLNEESDFFTSTVKKVLHFAPEQAFYKLFRNQKIWIILQLIYSPLADVKQTSVICPLKTINMMSFYVITF